MQFSVKEILEKIGYNPQEDCNGFFRMPAKYRGGDNPTSLSVNSKNGTFTDFKSKENGSLVKLVSLTLGINRKDAADLIGQKDTVIESDSSWKPILLKDLSDKIGILFPTYNFYNDRGISNETLKLFQSGLSFSGKMNHRYVFPVINKNGIIIGVAGRDVTGSKAVKWKIIGPKMKFDYPFYFTKDSILEKKEVILCESIGDSLKLFEAGIKNSLVLFGSALSNEILKLIIQVNPERIILALNNDILENGQSPGLEAADEIKKKLGKLFDVNIIKNCPPPAKDLCEMNIEGIKKWYESI